MQRFKDDMSGVSVESTRVFAWSSRILHNHQNYGHNQ